MTDLPTLDAPYRDSATRNGHGAYHSLDSHSLATTGAGVSLLR